MDDRSPHVVVTARCRRAVSMSSRMMLMLRDWARAFPVENRCGHPMAALGAAAAPVGVIVIVTLRMLWIVIVVVDWAVAVAMAVVRLLAVVVGVAIVVAVVVVMVMPAPGQQPRGGQVHSEAERGNRNRLAKTYGHRMDETGDRFVADQ